MCSTPNGIKGTYTLRAFFRWQMGKMCSTPNGIKGTYTGHTRYRWDSHRWVLNA